MQDPSVEETRRVAATPNTPPTFVDQLLRRPLVALAILGLILGGVVLLAAGGGYQAGISRRGVVQATAQADELNTQFALAVDDVQRGRYTLAIDRLTYILDANPDYPGAASLMAQAQRQLGESMPATVPPDRPPTPTQRVLDESVTAEALFADLQAANVSGSWDAVVDLAIALRSRFPGHESVRVDGYLFRALRNRGVDRIRTSPNTIELGLSDLGEAQKIGVLDAEAEEYEVFAYYYTNAVSLWGINWQLAADNLNTLYTIAPFFHDTYPRLLTANERFADQLAVGGASCDAVSVYEYLLTFEDNAAVSDKRDTAQEACDAGEEIGEGTPADDTIIEEGTPDAGDVATATPEADDSTE